MAASLARQASPADAQAPGWAGGHLLPLLQAALLAKDGKVGGVGWQEERKAAGGQSGGEMRWGQAAIERAQGRVGSLRARLQSLTTLT